MKDIYKLLRGFALLSLLALVAVGCSDDDDLYGTITLSQSSLYLTQAGAQSSFTFSTYNVSSISVSSMPIGWSLAISMSAKTIYVTAPSDISADTTSELEGTVMLSGVTPSDGTTSASFYVGIAESVDITDEISNSIFLTTPDKIYSFDATQTTPGGGTISASSAGIIWQSTPNALAYANLDDSGENLIFYINPDRDDEDEDGDTTEIIEGNALLGAFDKDGNVLWSWHIWASAEPFYDAAAPVVVNGKTIMNRNLGAFTNSNASSDDILTSYGLYYQWGRKEPFIYPSTYNASGGVYNSLTGDDGYSVTLSFEESDSDVGTMSYALENPLVFILGVEDSSYDWLYSAHDSELWGSTKTIYDPCPKGWRVADADAYVGLEISALEDADLNLEDYVSAYGWQLSDGSVDELFMGLGRRNYLTGTFQNVYPADSYLPWVGNYWTIGTSTSESNWSTSLYFTFDVSDEANNEVYPQWASQRANAMQIRCQKID